MPPHAPFHTGVQFGSGCTGDEVGLVAVLVLEVVVVVVVVVGATALLAACAAPMTADAGSAGSYHGGAIPVKKPSHWYLRLGCG
jgi:hypothetical protein